MMRYTSVPGILLLLSAMYFPAGAQSHATDQIKAKYPGEQAVVLNHSMNYRISIVNDTPQVESEETEQLLYLSAQAGAYMSKYGFTHSSFHVLQQYEAYTQTAEDKKIKVSNFKTADSQSDGIFYDDVKETSFDFPAVGPGSVGTLRLNILHKDPHLLSPFFFSRSVPAIHGELKIRFPKQMSIKYVLCGINKDKITFSQDTRRGENIYTFTVQDCPAEKAYPDAPGGHWYATHIVFFIEKYTDSKGQEKRYLGNPDDLYRLNHSYLGTINKEVKPELKHLVDSLVKEAPTQEAKARAVYNWVQRSIKYVAFEQGMEGFIPRDANLVCSRRFGDCKDMSSLLTTMLNAAGVPAYYTWIGTRSLPYDYKDVPTPISSNHMICTILLNGQYLFLDGTDPNCVFGAPSEGIQDKQALVAISDSAYKIITVPTVAKERNQLVDSTFLTLTDQGLQGNIVRNMSGYYSTRMHGLLSRVREKDLQEYMKDRFTRGSNKFRLDTFAVGNQDDKDHIRLTARFSLPDYAKHIGNEWYLNLNLFKLYEHDEIDYPKRKMPVEYNFHDKRKYVVVLQIPDGYQISYLPRNKSYHNDVWGFDISYEKKGNTLIMTQQFDNDYLLLEPEKFADWNKVLENLFPLYKESLGLAKS